MTCLNTMLSAGVVERSAKGKHNPVADHVQEMGAGRMRLLPHGTQRTNQKARNSEGHADGQADNDGDQASTVDHDNMNDNI